jgi:hypothetical protein
MPYLELEVDQFFVVVVPYLELEMRFDFCTTPSQQVHNNPSHEGGPQCCKSNIFLFL